MCYLESLEGEKEEWEKLGSNLHKKKSNGDLSGCRSAGKKSFGVMKTKGKRNLGCVARGIKKSIADKRTKR